MEDKKKFSCIESIADIDKILLPLLTAEFVKKISAVEIVILLISAEILLWWQRWSRHGGSFLPFDRFNINRLCKLSNPINN
jgi:hypothetical protein